MAQPLPPDQTATGYQSATGRTRAQLLAYATALWASLGSYQPADIDGFIAALVPRVLAGQLAIANLTSVFLAHTTAGPGRAIRPLPVDPKLVQDGRGVPPMQVYRRPAIEVYTALKNDVPLEEAITRGKDRLESLVSTDLQMAKVRQADASLQASGAKFYRRVLKGEHNCAKCIITSTLRYRVGNLLPIHPGCDCEVEPIEGNRAPLVLDPQLLEDTHEMVKKFTGKSTRGAQGYQDLIVTHEHGEIGPVMSWRGQKFTGPAEIH